MKTPPLPSVPDFAASAEDHARASELQEQYDELSALANSLTRDALTARRDSALAAFTNKPSAETLGALKQAEIEKEAFSINSRLRSMARGAVDTFLQQEVRPWALPLVERALHSAREYHAQLTSQEQTRHKALTGRDLGRSELLEIAGRPVTVLETIFRELEYVDTQALKMEISDLRAVRADHDQALFKVLHLPAAHPARAERAAAYAVALEAEKQTDLLLTEKRSQAAAQRVRPPMELLAAITSAGNPLRPRRLAPAEPEL